ncbi:FAD/NAD-P-binding domain-containing protein [Lentinula aciculospora]|uniref:FAD/NAD-P-binding domain-containing protein n=1 Tax=Lentinula aciculospora TaxID=153920 RepID=A0A9W9AEY2_9AGAR|nr:FAD/NAD-P-binding domain-containing protein [Lentinula aciculospora]
MKLSSFKFVPHLLLGPGLLLCRARVVSSAAHPVCIVGAGPSGLIVAHELKSCGVSTVIFDSNAEVGGKCQSYYDDPIARTTYHVMGALIFTNLTYSNTLQLILEAGLPLSPALSPGPSANSQDVTKTAIPTPAEDAVIASEVVAYTVLWNTEFQPEYTESRYPNGVPSELTLPMSEWLSTKGFKALPVFVEEGLVYEGYGDFSQTPALYALQFLTPEILTYYIGTTPGYFVDFHKLWVWYAETYVSGPIYSSTNVTKIDRSGENPIITYISAGNSSSSTQTCSSLVLAFPPTNRALTAAGLDITLNEQSLFADVGVTAYWSTAFNMSELPYPYAFLKDPPTSDFSPLAMLRYFSDSPIATAYSFGTSPYNESTSDSNQKVMDLIIQAATDLGIGIAANQVGGVTTANTVTADDIKLFTRQDHFPHVLTDALAGNFYEKYNLLQGQRSTYWTSGLNRFENVESVILAAKDLVEHIMF